jgi:pimeloyl-ACP methyl ester carboxylesterase/DNA-binding CsgD family transcriptional regulator
VSNTPSDRRLGALRLGALVDALTDYVIDPTHWQELTDQLEKIEFSTTDTDTGDLLVQLSKAETLSWQIKNDTGDLTDGGFAFVLLDDKDRVVGHSDNLQQISEYLAVSDRKLEFTNEQSGLSLRDAKAKLRVAPHGHILVEISHPQNSRRRYGYLVAASEFPEALKVVGKNATSALFIAQERPDDKIRNIVQASFTLTAAETDIMLIVASGTTLKDAASELGISVNTVRNHLQSIYAKSGINRQGDLVLVVTQLSIMIAATGGQGGRRAGSKGAHGPVATQHFMILPDGRRIAYRTYGNPMGRPVLYLHESIGSSRLLPDTQQLCEQHNLYLVAPERPGCGHSDPNPEFVVESVCNDLVFLLDHLRIQNCQILGFLTGGSYAMKMADLHPDRVSHLMLVASRTLEPMSGRFQLLATVRHKMVNQPWVLSTFFNILRNRASKEMFGKLLMSIYGSVAHDRQLLENRPEIFQHMVEYTLESLSVSTAGVINELECFNTSEVDTLSNLAAPITVWHGTDDALASLADLQKFLGSRIDRLRTFEGGSLILLEYWPELLGELAKNADDLWPVP